MKLIDYSVGIEFTELTYEDGSKVKVKTSDFNRAFKTIVDADKEVVNREFGIEEKTNLTGGK